MSGVVVAVSKEVAFSRAQKSFNRLKKRVEKLKRDGERMRADLDDSLSFFHGQVEPARKRSHSILCECVKLLYGFHEAPPKSLSARECRLLKEMVIDTGAQALEQSSRDERDPAISAIYRELTGEDFDDELDDELNRQREQMEEELKEVGIDIDFSDVDMQQDHVSLKQQLAEKFAEAMQMREGQEPTTQKARKKTKKQIEKEQKEALILERQQQGVASLYKQLVKMAHPDHEQDPVIKQEKEAFLKRVTVAYEKRDLCELLSLELEWMQRSDEQETGVIERQIGEDELLEAYNSMLKEQVRELNHSLQAMPSSLRYFEIASFGDDPVSIMIGMRDKLKTIEKQRSLYTKIVDQLRGRAPVRSLGQILRDYSQELSMVEIDPLMFLMLQAQC